MPKISSSWDISKSLPDGHFFCDAFGKEKHNGKYLAWPIATAKQTSTNKVITVVPGGTLAAQECYIAKAIIPHVREKAFSYKNALQNPIDLTDGRLMRKIHAKANRILTKLGVAYNDRVGVIVPKNTVATAAWFCRGNKEGIYVNPWWIIKGDQQCLTRLIKKEVIHKALYRNYKELTNKRLLNFTLDIISLRAVAQTPFDRIDKQSARLVELLLNVKLYKKYPILALLDCSLDEKQAKKLPLQIFEIWKSLYGLDKNGCLPDILKIKPSTLYFKLKSMLPEEMLHDFEWNAGFNNSTHSGIQYPFNIQPSQDHGNGTSKDESISPGASNQVLEVEKKVRNTFVPRRYRVTGGYSNSMTRFWDIEVVEKKDFVDERLKKFSEKWRTEKILDDVTSKIVETLSRQNVSVDLFPRDLTNDGMMLMALGISGDLFPYYFNHAPEIRTNRKKILGIFDLSPSMGMYLPYMAKIVDSIENMCDVVFSVPDKENQDETTKGALGFSGSVRTISETEIEDMKRGKFQIGETTSFEAVLQYILKNIKTDGVDCCIIFTDGESSVSEDLAAKFNGTNKTIHRVYFSPPQEADSEGEVKTVITSPLDMCKGESFTLALPPADSIED